jgi:hypothetical protein
VNYFARIYYPSRSGDVNRFPPMVKRTSPAL